MNKYVRFVCGVCYLWRRFVLVCCEEYTFTNKQKVKKDAL